jgi:arylformamidase
MKIFDITLTITPELPVWPGDPAVQLERVSKIEDGANANVSRVSMGVHTGTHIDAPYHFINESTVTVEQLSLEVLTGIAHVYHLPDSVDVVTSQVLEQLEIPVRARRLLFRTRNSTYWAQSLSQFQTDFVGLDTTAAQYLADRGVWLVGIDYLSVAPYKKSRPTHEILLKAGLVVLEGVNLSSVPAGKYTLYCLPLKLGGSDGAPARTILVGV